MPRRGVLVALFAVVAASPLVARASGTVVGAFSMFTRIERYHLELAVLGDAGEEAIRLRSLVRHLSREAQRALVPADGYAVGADQVDIVAGGLQDLARLLCDVRPDAASARVRLFRGPFAHKEELRRVQLEMRCERRR